MRILAGCMVVLLAACGPSRGEPAAGAGDVAADTGVRGGQAAAAAPTLATSLSARVSPDSVELTLYVTNVGRAPLRLQYRTSQRYDFTVRSASGRAVWRWSAGRSFMQVLGEEVLEAGATRAYTAVWREGVRPGAYGAEARLTAAGGAVAERTRFEVPSE